MREEDVEPFRQKINEICTLTEDDLQEKNSYAMLPMPVILCIVSGWWRSWNCWSLWNRQSEAGVCTKRC